MKTAVLCLLVILTAISCNVSENEKDVLEQKVRAANFAGQGKQYRTVDTFRILQIERIADNAMISDIVEKSEKQIQEIQERIQKNKPLILELRQHIAELNDAAIKSSMSEADFRDTFMHYVEQLETSKDQFMEDSMNLEDIMKNTDSLKAIYTGTDKKDNYHLLVNYSDSTMHGLTRGQYWFYVDKNYKIVWSEVKE